MVLDGGTSPFYLGVIAATTEGNINNRTDFYDLRLFKASDSNQGLTVDERVVAGTLVAMRRISSFGNCKLVLIR